jgi:hypothetical protein
MAYPDGAWGTWMKVSSTLPEWIWVKPFVLAVASLIVALDEPTHDAAFPFCVTVAPLTRQLVFAANDTLARAVDPFVTSRVPPVQRPWTPSNTSKYD